MLDSSVLVASLIPSDKYYSEGTTVVRRLLVSEELVHKSRHTLLNFSQVRNHAL